MLYLCRGALSSEARFIVSLGMVWFGDRVVYPGLPSEDRAAKHMGKLLLAQLMASTETLEPTQSCLQSQAGDKFLLQRRRGAPQEPKPPSSRSQKSKKQTSFVSHFLRRPNPGTEWKGIKEQYSTPQRSGIEDAQAGSHQGAPDIHSLNDAKSLLCLQSQARVESMFTQERPPGAELLEIPGAWSVMAVIVRKRGSS